MCKQRLCVIVRCCVACWLLLFFVFVSAKTVFVLFCVGVSVCVLCVIHCVTICGLSAVFCVCCVCVLVCVFLFCARVSCVLSIVCWFVLFVFKCVCYVCDV